jgi:hypothetical protein
MPTDYTKEIEEILHKARTDYDPRDGDATDSRELLKELIALIHLAQREERERIIKGIENAESEIRQESYRKNKMPLSSELYYAVKSFIEEGEIGDKNHPISVRLREAANRGRYGYDGLGEELLK